MNGRSSESYFEQLFLKGTLRSSLAIIMSCSTGAIGINVLLKKARHIYETQLKLGSSKIWRTYYDGQANDLANEPNEDSNLWFWMTLSNDPVFNNNE